MHTLRDRGKTVFLCSHLLKEMEPMCDSVVVLSRGVVRRQGRVCDLLSVQSGRYQLRATGCANLPMQSLKDKALDLTVTGDEVALLFANQKQALAAAQEIDAGGGSIIELGAQTRSLEDVFIEAVAGGGSD